MTLAHHLVAVIYHVLGRGEQYVELGADYYHRRNDPRTVSRVIKRLTNLRYHVSLAPVVPISVDAEIARVEPGHCEPATWNPDPA